MKITVMTLSDEIFVLDVSADLELENFKAFCEVESGIPANEISILFNGQPLMDNKKSIGQHGIHDGDVVVLQHMRGRETTSRQNDLGVLDFSSIRVPQNSASRSLGPASEGGSQSEDDPARIRDMLLANPDQLALLKQNNRRLADALLTGNLATFAQVLREQMQIKEERQAQHLRMLNADPFDTEAQRLIAEEIRKKNIEANMEAAMEYNPETFGSVVMLYINCKVNGHPVKAFVDSGAQQTIMSAKCAERCNIMRLVDNRFAGIAKGVGVQRIIGRVHMVQIQIGNDHLTSSFSILEEQPMDMLLGLDMLKRHQCCIDLNRNVLVIGTTGTETPFLAESELPRSDFPEDEEAELQKVIEDSTKTEVKKDAASTSRTNSSEVQMTPTDPFTESTVKDLVALGFSRNEAITELRRFNGDKMQATAALFAKSLKF